MEEARSAETSAVNNQRLCWFMRRSECSRDHKLIGNRMAGEISLSSTSTEACLSGPSGVGTQAICWFCPANSMNAGSVLLVVAHCMSENNTSRGTSGRSR
jgi:hypothetical protein